jgi:hypothetical protein
VGWVGESVKGPGAETTTVRTGATALVAVLRVRVVAVCVRVAMPDTGGRDDGVVEGGLNWAAIVVVGVVVGGGAEVPGWDGPQATSMPSRSGTAP